MAVLDFGIDGDCMTKYAKYLILIFCVLASMQCNAGWIGPVKVLSGDFGGGADQFGMEQGDTSNSYAELDDVSSSGNILIADQINHRIKVYKPDGSLLTIINSPAKDPSGWGIEASFVGENIFANVDNYYLYSINGTQISWDEAAGVEDSGAILAKDGDLYIEETSPEHKWLIYSSNGKLLKTDNNRPSELGTLNDNVFYYQGIKLYRIINSYPNAKYISVNSSGACFASDYLVDSSGHLYCQLDNGISRYNVCGKIIGDFNLPQPQEYAPEPSSIAAAAGIENIRDVALAYHDLHLAPNGDLYASQVTGTTYSVVKWTWQDSPYEAKDGPDAPVQLEGVSDTTGSVMLKWVYSLQDPGCVTGYEVGRSTTKGGPYSAVGTVQLGDINKGYAYHDSTGKSGTTYYYAVRAVSAIGDSPYSNEVSVTVK